MIRTTAKRPRIRRRTLIISAPRTRCTTPRVKRRELTLSGAKSAQATYAVPFAPDPYIDYARYLTAEGGIAIVYKDIDERWRFIVRRFCLWAGVTGVGAWLLLYHSPVHALAINLIAIVTAGFVNWLIVRQPIEVYRTIEIRPDSMILDGRDIFWLRYMETLPTFGPGADGTQVMSGVYGTRHVEYLKARDFDQFDSMPEVLAAHLQEAMRQLWSWPYW